MKKIYFLVDEFPRLGGAEVVTDRLAQELANRGIPVTVVCRTKGAQKYKGGAYTTRCWSPLSYAQKRSAIQGIPLIMKPLGFTLVALRKVKKLAWAVDITEKILSRRIVSSWDADDIVVATRGDILDIFLAQSDFRRRGSQVPLIINQFHTSLDPLGEYGAFIEESYRNRDVISGLTVLSQRCQESFIGEWRLPVLVLPNPNPSDAEYVLRDFSKTVVVAARLVESKQVDISIQAFKKFISYPEFSDWSMRIFGAGTEEENLKKYVKELGLDTQVSFMGLTAPGKMFSRAGLHLMCSRFEGRPLVIQEAGCYGIPTIAFNVSGGVHDLVHSLSGGLAEPGDLESLVELMKVNARLAGQRENAQRIVNQVYQYDVERVATRFVSWLNELKVTKSTKAY
ncbi:glycosyltransferase [Rothia nasimurium]|uniref:glycosyltransferase n=1 Tax=Rothia nasimurium TaxID=85336 RepID=UPI001F1F6BB5|nr:glycosyltransferase [Rothia nasimurium]